MGNPTQTKTLGCAARDAVFVALVYLVLYTAFLVKTNFLPYVFDNNESFSAYVHGSNLYHFGLSKSYGLTDEAYGVDPAAHPYVYTHQGNFPRIVAYLMYAAGIRTIEAQIAVSTLTTGLATVLLVWAVFREIGGRSAGLLAATLFMTEYILTAQWLVNTFQVWHALLLFSMLWLIERYRRTRSASQLALLTLASLCVGYFDLLMGVFTFVFCGVYALLKLRRYGRRAVTASLGAMAAGGATSVLVLVTQLLLYYGWSGLKEDFYLTFVARNYAATADAAATGWQAFFVKHHIVFWEAMVDSRPFATLGSALRSVFEYGFTVFTPYFSYLMLSLAGAAAIGLGRDATTVAHGTVAVSRDVTGRLVLYVAVAALTATLLLGAQGLGLALVYGAAALIAPRIDGSFGHRLGRVTRRVALTTLHVAVLYAINLLLALLCLTDLLEGHATPAFQLAGATRGLGPLLILSLAPTLLIAWLTRGFWVPDSRTDRPARLRFGRFVASAQHVASVGIYYMLAVALLLAQARLYADPGLALGPVWDYVLRPWAPSGATKLFAVLAIGLGTSWLLAGFPVRARGGMLRAALAYLAAALAGYLAAYFFSPGYMVLINLKRFTPVLIFLMLPIAVAAFALLVDAVRDGVHAWITVPRPGASGGSASTRWGGLVALLLLLHAVVFWLGRQSAYMALMPPDGGRVFQQLAQPPFRGKSFVVNSYGAPVATATGSWAYIDQRLVNSGHYKLTSDGYRPDGNSIYLWMTDRANPKYAFPDYALCYQMPGFSNAARVLELMRLNPKIAATPADVYDPRGPKGAASFVAPNLYACGGAFATQRQAGAAAAHGPTVTIVRKDPSLLSRWAIAKLEDDFPPFLAVLHRSDGARVEVRIERAQSECRADVHYVYRQQQGKPEAGTTLRAWLNPSSGDKDGLGEPLPVSGADGFELPRGATGELRVAVTPSTRTRRGETFWSAPITVHGC